MASSSSSVGSGGPNHLIIFVNGMTPALVNWDNEDEIKQAGAGWCSKISAATKGCAQVDFVHNPAGSVLVAEQVGLNAQGKRHKAFVVPVTALLDRTNEFVYGPNRTVESKPKTGRKVTWFLHSYGTTIARFALQDLGVAQLPLRIVGVGEVLWGREHHGTNHNWYNQSVPQANIYNFRDMRDGIAKLHNAMHNPHGAALGLLNKEPVVEFHKITDLAWLAGWWDQNSIHSLDAYLTFIQVVDELRK